MTDHTYNNIVNLKSRAKGAEESAHPLVLSRTARKYPAEAPERKFVGTEYHLRVEFLSPIQQFFARMVTTLLIPMMLVSPIARVYADETTEATPTSTAETISQPTIESLPPAEQTPATEVAEAVIPDTSEQVEIPTPAEVGATPDVEPASENTNEEEPVDSTVTPIDTSDISQGSDPEDTVPPPQVDETPLATSTDVIPVEEPVYEGGADHATTTEVVPVVGGDIDSDESTPNEEITEEEATTTDSEIISAEEVIVDNSAQLQAEREYQELRARNQMRKEVEQEFLRGCISFETAGYYCLNSESRNAGGAVSKKASVQVISEQINSADKEIVVVHDGERTVLTDNDWDDTFPTQDVSGEHFVWQGMKGGRWQIFSATLSGTGTPKINQVTDSRESNFNPKIDGEHLVWQGWADENWEIFFATKRDPKSILATERLPEGNGLLGVGPEWAVERLTKNSHHDMFPSLHGDLITWQAREGADWIVYAYSIKAKKQTKLSSDGVKSENPRFSITWEERDQEGRVRLVGYDLSTGEKTDITKESQRLPTSSFPEPIQTPVSYPDPAALPITQNSGSSTTQRADDESGGDNLLLP